ncbi:hypothetical protein Vi05172_g2133 [Venturia inaequalis]|nr:hypothetical protein Vi05172_g2133 [Venturia inaequalis]
MYFDDAESTNVDISDASGEDVDGVDVNGADVDGVGISRLTDDESDSSSTDLDDAEFGNGDFGLTWSGGLMMQNTYIHLIESRKLYGVEGPSFQMTVFAVTSSG